MVVVSRPDPEASSLSPVAWCGYAWPAGVCLRPAEHLVSLLQVQGTVSIPPQEITAFIPYYEYMMKWVRAGAHMPFLAQRRK